MRVYHAAPVAVRFPLKAMDVVSRQPLDDWRVWNNTREMVFHVFRAEFLRFKLTVVLVVCVHKLALNFFYALCLAPILEKFFVYSFAASCHYMAS
ncbi:hypothetical protein KVR801_60047 [Klebsiella variicola]|nr:hypothetical protein KVR801_60047 [Klebsiella variicola]